MNDETLAKANKLSKNIGNVTDVLKHATDNPLYIEAPTKTTSCVKVNVGESMHTHLLNLLTTRLVDLKREFQALYTF